jgi:hypothetical protein
VTVVDPRHPLFDQSFPLLHLTNKQELIPSCRVLLAEGAERLIPISATDLAVSPPVVFPLPLDISSLHNLTQAFVRIQAQIEEECGDGSAGSSQFNRDGRPDADYLGDTECSATENGSANGGSDLLPDRRAVGAGGGS